VQLFRERLSAERRQAPVAGVYREHPAPLRAPAPAAPPPPWTGPDPGLQLARCEGVPVQGRTL